MNVIKKQWTTRLGGVAAIMLGLALPMTANADHRHRGYAKNGAIITVSASPRYYSHKRNYRLPRYSYRAPGYSYYITRPYRVMQAPAYRHYHSRSDWRHGRYCDDNGHRRFDQYYTPPRRHYQRH